jgi:hypothetical protein
MDKMGFGYRLYPSYNGYNGVSGKGIHKMIDPLIAKHDELPALPTQGRLLFLHRGTGQAAAGLPNTSKDYAPLSARSSRPTRLRVR